MSPVRRGRSFRWLGFVGLTSFGFFVSGGVTTQAGDNVLMNAIAAQARAQAASAQAAAAAVATDRALAASTARAQAALQSARAEFEMSRTLQIRPQIVTPAAVVPIVVPPRVVPAAAVPTVVPPRTVPGDNALRRIETHEQRPEIPPPVVAPHDRGGVPPHPHRPHPYGRGGGED